MIDRRWLLAPVVVAAMLLGAPAPAQDAGSPSWIPLSAVMSELSQDPAFVDTVLRRLGQNPDDGGVIGPTQIRRLRELILGKHWEAVDRFPGLTVTGLGRAVRLAAAAHQHLRGADAPTDAPLDSNDQPLAHDITEPLAIPAPGPPLPADAYLRGLGFGLEIGDRVDPARAADHADDTRLADVLNRLAMNPDAGQPGPRYRVQIGSGVADTPKAAIALLAGQGHAIEVADARYFANFGDLIYQGRDVLTPFWLDTEIPVPGTGRSLLVPVGHAQHELRIGGPLLDSRLSFYFGIDGRVAFRPIDTLDQSWVLGRIAHVYRGDAALDVVALAGAIMRSYAHIKRTHPDLAFGGYYALGVCNDVNAMIELRMQGATTLFPITLDTRYFQGNSEVDRLARQLPIDRAGAQPDPRRIFGSLPVDDPALIPLPGLRQDLQLVKSAWSEGKLALGSSWDSRTWGAAAAILAALHIAFAWRQKRASPGKTSG